MENSSRCAEPLPVLVYRTSLRLLQQQVMATRHGLLQVSADLYRINLNEILYFASVDLCCS